MMDATAARLTTQMLDAAAHLRPADVGAHVHPNGGPQLVAFSAGFHAGPDGPTTGAWLFDAEGRTETAHQQMERSHQMATPHGHAAALRAHLLDRAPLLVSNGFEVAWIVGPGATEAFELRLYRRQRTVSAGSAGAVAEVLGRLASLLSPLASGTRRFVVEQKGHADRTEILAAGPEDAARYWMVMQSLDGWHRGVVAPPYRVIEDHPMDQALPGLATFGQGLPDLRIPPKG